MAPAKRKDTLLELCTNCTVMGNTIAVHALEYLSVAKNPPHGFKELSVEFLETARVLIPAKGGLEDAARSGTEFSADETKDLTNKLRQIDNNFLLINQVVNKLLDGARKQGFGKLGKSFRMIFVDTDIDKLKLSLVASREAFRASSATYEWTVSDDKSNATDGIGYTALAAVLGRPDPLRPSKIAENRQAVNGPNSRAPMPESQPPANLPPRDTSFNYANGRSLLELNALGESDLSTPSSRSTQPFSFESSVRSSGGDNESEITRMSTVTQIEEMWAHSFDTIPKHAVRVKADPAAAPRWTPKRSAGPPTAESKLALATAVQQKNSKMVEQLLDRGVPANNGPELNLLREAVANFDLPTVRLLLLFGAEPNAKDMKDYTPLYTATEGSFIEAAQLLVKYGGDPNISAGPAQATPFAASLVDGKAHFSHLYLKHGADPDSLMLNGNTAFIQAMDKLTPAALIELMLLYDANPNRKNGRGETALFGAINSRRNDLVTMLLENGADPNLPGPKHMLWPSVHQPKILRLLLEGGANLARAPGVLELATSVNSVEAVESLLKYGADPNAKKDGIFTPLCTAIRDDHENLVDILIAAGANPNLPASEYPAFKCVTHHRPHLLPRVLAAGANPNKPKGIIETAVAHDEKQALQILLKHDVDVNARSPAGNTALTTAIRLNKPDLIDILLAHDANPAIRGHDWPIQMAVSYPTILEKLLLHLPSSKVGKGVLEMAVVANQLDSIKMLLAKGVDVEEKNGGVFSPLTTSIRENRKDIFRFLIDEAGADPNSPGEHLPIIKAIRRHKEDDLSYIEHLIARGADINLMYRGYNAVLQALENGNLRILKLLADRGNPDLNAVNEDGKSVLDILQERGLEEEEEILLGGCFSTPKVQDALHQLRGMVVR